MEIPTAWASLPIYPHAFVPDGRPVGPPVLQGRVFVSPRDWCELLEVCANRLDAAGWPTRDRPTAADC